MKYNSELAKFNSARGTLLILRILHNQAPLDRKTLLSEFEKYGLIGSRSFESSLFICENLGLVQKTKERFHLRGTISLMHSLTERGKKIAEFIVEIDNLLR